MKQAEIGLIGLAVMGQNLVLNMSDHHIPVAVYNRSRSKTDAFLEGSAKGRDIKGCYTLEELVSSLRSPRRVMLMVKAGEAVDAAIGSLLPLLAPGDIIIDGGNSHFADSNRRLEALGKKQIRYIATGVSGGEAGARSGPSIMPGGDSSAWPVVRDIFQAISARVDNTPCCEWIGPEGSGHYVKMVHNGIEYGDMQLIAEAYDLLHRGLGLSADEMQAVFAGWNLGVLDSYLIGITADILARKEDNGTPLVNLVLDAAGQKGTGKWTAVDALDNGSPLTLITEAVFARALSSRKEERVIAEKFYEPERPVITTNREAAINAIHDALYAAKIISYTQGFMLMHDAATTYSWNLDYRAIAMVWRGGCIIRSRFLNNIMQAYASNPALTNLLLDPFFRQQMVDHLHGWREALKMAIDAAIPVPAMASALAFFDGYCSGTLPANLIQAQRDLFGAHTYERTDRPRGEFFHTNWSLHDSDHE